MPLDDPSQLALDGRALMQISGRDPGPWIGHVLDTLLDKVVSGEVINHPSRWKRSGDYMDRTLREAVLQLFTNADSYLSGEEISRTLGCTRTAVWKQIHELRSIGYVFDAKPRKGYRLKERPDVVIPEEIHCFNGARQLGKRFAM